MESSDDLLARLMAERPPSAPLQGTESAAGAIKRVHYTHDAMIDMLIANPGISQNAIAKHFGYQAAWVSRILNSDAFNLRLAERKKDLVDPTIMLTVDEKLKALASRSLDVLQEKLETAPTTDLALEAAKLSTKALGFGARPMNAGFVQNNFVVALPGKVASQEAWAERTSGRGAEDATIIPPDLAALVGAERAVPGL